MRFDKAAVAGHAKALVVLELRLERKGQVLRQQTYAASEAVAGTTMNGFTDAMEVALNRIYGGLLADLGQVKLDEA